jgi:hypothetical protein
MASADKLAAAISEFIAVLQPVFYYFGLIIFILGVMAFALNKKHGPFHIWGRRLAILGAGFVVLGYNPNWLVSLVNYAIGA